MKNLRDRLGCLHGIFFFAAATMSFHSCSVFAQEVESQSASATRSHNDPSPAPHDSANQTQPKNDLTGGVLPDAPDPQIQTQNEPPPTFPASGTHLNQFPVLPPGLTRMSLTTADKFQIYIHKTYGPPAVILPGFGAGLQMANPKSTYPKDWKDGMAAFGRNYGYRVADHTARNSAQFLTDVLLHEDPRYQRSTGTNPLGRTFHALAFTVFDKTDSGKTTFAAGNFASAAAGGFVGLGILPHGYDDMTHAEQHMASELASLAIGNLLTEYEPEWGPWAKKLRIPKILPAWWVPQHPNHP